MIEINLLPPDMKPSEGTPPKRFGLYILWVLMAAGMAFGVINFYRVRIPQLTRDTELVKAEAKEEEVKKKLVDELRTKIKDLTDKVGKFDELNASRVRFGRVLDALCTAVVTDNEGVWLKSMSITSENARSGGAAGATAMPQGKKYVINLTGYSTAPTPKERFDKLTKLLTNIDTEFKVAKGTPPNPVPEKWGFNEHLKVRFDPAKLKSYATVKQMPKPTIPDPKPEVLKSFAIPVSADGKTKSTPVDELKNYKDAVLAALQAPEEGTDFVMEIRFELPAPKPAVTAPAPAKAAPKK